MPKQSAIEWTNWTWNPVTGCSKVSQGCKHCYAERMAKRLKAMGSPRYTDGFRVTLHDDLVELPRRWKSPRLIFVNSMSDLFHEKVPFDYVESVFQVMAQAHWHTFQVLTKRAERMRDFCRTRRVPPNTWLGVSVENRKHGVPRIDVLREVDATIRFLSVEPLLEDVGRIDLSDIHWVIVGGESGPRARPMRAEWAESVRRQCLEADVAFFFKQWGAWGADGQKRSKKANGRELNGQSWDGMPA